jgi:ubiquinone/menaquinone biosynthesis C-methylase UbiE
MNKPLGPDESFGAIASSYKRPPYPDELIDIIIQKSGLKEGDTVADIGAGNGLLGLAFAKRGYKVIFVDPSKKMLEQISTVQNSRTVEGRAEKTGLENKSVDLIVAGNAAHWFPQNDETAKEFTRILKPNKKAVFINMNPSLEDPLIGHLHEIMEQGLDFYRRRPAYVFQEPHKAFNTAESLLEKGGRQHEHKTFSLPMTASQVIDYLGTTHTFSQQFITNPKLKEDLLEICKSIPEQSEIKYRYDMYMGSPKTKDVKQSKMR